MRPSAGRSGGSGAWDSAGVVVRNTILKEACAARLRTRAGTPGLCAAEGEWVEPKKDAGKEGGKKKKGKVRVAADHRSKKGREMTGRAARGRKGADLCGPT